MIWNIPCYIEANTTAAAAAAASSGALNELSPKFCEFGFELTQMIARSFVLLSFTDISRCTDRKVLTHF